MDREEVLRKIFAQGVFSKFNNPILDLEQVNGVLDDLVSQGKIQEENPIGKTECGFPIKHFSLGEGDIEIPIIAGMHGNEIGSVDMILRTMEYLSGPSNTTIDLQKYKFHFIPVVNPEGYVTVTSALKKLIPDDMSAEDTEKICKAYYTAFRNDDIAANKRNKEGNINRDPNFRGEHNMFSFTMDDENVISTPEKVYESIPRERGSEYEKLYQSLKSLNDKYPENFNWRVWDFKANGEGLDLQNATKLFEGTQALRNGNTEPNYYDDTRFSNIDRSKPAPLGNGMNTEKGFKVPNETKALVGFLDSVSNLSAIFNLCSTGGRTFSLPTEPNGKIAIDSQKRKQIEVENRAIARAFEEGSTIDEECMKEAGYKTVEWQINKKLTSLNELLTLTFPNVLLIELFKMGGNPIGEYGDFEGSYKKTIRQITGGLTRAIEVVPLISSFRKRAEKMRNNRNNFEPRMSRYDTGRIPQTGKGPDLDR